jgi:hypothetical protein
VVNLYRSQPTHGIVSRLELNGRGIETKLLLDELDGRVTEGGVCALAKRVVHTSAEGLTTQSTP